MNVFRELADTWAVWAATEPGSTPERRATLRECADTVRTLASTQRAPDPVVEANRQLLLERSRVGVAKYGTTLADAGLSRDELVQHALEEALDLANYLQALLKC